jgi:hypothetical protein
MRQIGNKGCGGRAGGSWPQRRASSAGRELALAEDGRTVALAEGEEGPVEVGEVFGGAVDVGADPEQGFGHLAGGAGHGACGGDDAVPAASGPL